MVIKFVSAVSWPSSPAWRGGLLRRRGWDLLCWACEAFVGLSAIDATGRVFFGGFQERLDFSLPVAEWGRDAFDPLERCRCW